MTAMTSTPQNPDRTAPRLLRAWSLRARAGVRRASARAQTGPLEDLAAFPRGKLEIRRGQEGEARIRACGCAD